MNKTVNYLKALGIILMVIGHSGCGIPQAVPFIYMFHMPLFFFVSGFCFKRTGLNEAKQFFWKRIKGLWWPFVKWSLFFLVLHNLFLRLHIIDSNVYDIREHIARAFYISFQMVDTEQLLGGFWFLPALLSGYIVSWVLLKLFKRIEIGGGISLIISVLLNFFPEVFTPTATGIAKFIPLSLILCSARSFEVAFYIIVGHWFAAKNIKPFNWWQITVCIILTFVGSYFWRINTGEMFFENNKYLPYLVTSILATWSFYSLFLKVADVKNRITRILSFVGTNTITILTWHMLVFKLVSLLIIKIYNLPIEGLSEFPVIHEFSKQGWWALYVVVALAVCCGIAYLNKWISKSWLKL